MGIREKYPFPSEKEYKYSTELEEKTLILRILQSSIIISVMIIAGSVIAFLLFPPDMTVIYPELGELSVVYQHYFPLLIWIALGAIVFIAALIMNFFIMPWNFLSKNKKPEDYQGKVPIECGETDVKGTGMVQFGFQYYPFALIYIVFDVVGVFLMLWALLYGEVIWGGDLGLYFVAIILFMLGPIVSLAFWLKKDKIKWS